jgi:hypothetical protein
MVLKNPKIKFTCLEASFHFIQKGAVLNLQWCKPHIFIELKSILESKRK